MKINDTHQKLLEAYLNQVHAVQGQQAQQVQHERNASQQQATQSTDKVDLSSGSRLMQQVNKAMYVKEPERTAYVNALRDQIQQGTYQVNAEKVADKMMTDLIKDLG